MSTPDERIDDLCDRIAELQEQIHQANRRIRETESDLERRIGNLEDDHRRLENEVSTISRS